jgi:medium-chain acyl-[acyl-carrier-protein] hydrolase
VVEQPWYSVFVSRPEAPIRLYCLPCAGGGATMYRELAERLPPTFELRAIRLPGRHARYGEPAFTDCETAAGALADALAAELRRPYVLFGHSMGALIGHRLVEVIERRGMAPPALFVSASWLVQGFPLERLPDPAASDERFVDVLRRLGGVAPGVLGDPEVLAFTLPLLRADFRLCRSYAYRPDDMPQLRAPMRAMGGAADHVTPVDQMGLWGSHARRFLGVRAFPGGHFFLNDNAEAVVETLAADVAALA